MWNSIVSWFKGLFQSDVEKAQEPTRVTDRERAADKQAVIHESTPESKPAKSVTVHNWTEAEFDNWFSSLGEKELFDLRLGGPVFPKKFPKMEDWRYWRRRANIRADELVKETVVPVGHGMGADGRQRRQ